MAYLLHALTPTPCNTMLLSVLPMTTFGHSYLSHQVGLAKEVAYLQHQSETAMCLTAFGEFWV